MSDFMMLLAGIAVIVLTIFFEVMYHKIFHVVYFSGAAMVKELFTCFLISFVIVAFVFGEAKPIKSKASPAEQTEAYDEESMVEDDNTLSEENKQNEINDDESYDEYDSVNDETNNDNIIEKENGEYIEEDVEDSYVGDNNDDGVDFDDEYVEKNKGLEGIDDSDYILINSHIEYINQSFISSFTKEELRLARNEIYARHGCIFKSADLNTYFNSKSWYTPTIPVADFDTSRFNKYELANIETIKSLE